MSVKAKKATEIVEAKADELEKQASSPVAPNDPTTLKIEKASPITNPIELMARLELLCNDSNMTIRRFDEYIAFIDVAKYVCECNNNAAAEKVRDLNKKKAFNIAYLQRIPGQKPTPVGLPSEVFKLIMALPNKYTLVRQIREMCSLEMVKMLGGNVAVTTDEVTAINAVYESGKLSENSILNAVREQAATLSSAASVSSRSSSFATNDELDVINAKKEAELEIAQARKQAKLEILEARKKADAVGRELKIARDRADAASEELKDARERADATGKELKDARERAKDARDRADFEARKTKALKDAIEFYGDDKYFQEFVKNLLLTSRVDFPEGYEAHRLKFIETYGDVDSCDEASCDEASCDEASCDEAKAPVAPVKKTLLYPFDLFRAFKAFLVQKLNYFWSN